MPSFGGNSGGGGGGLTPVHYQLTVTTEIAAARTFDTPSTPTGSVWLTLVGVGDQRPGVDYTVSGRAVSWGPTGGLADVLSVGDVLIVEYATA